MSNTTHRKKLVVSAAVLTVVLLLAGPLPAGAQDNLDPAGSNLTGDKSAGEFDVVPGDDGSGDATGEVVSTTVFDGSVSADGTVLEDYSIRTSAETETTVFSSVAIDGFQPTGRLEGVGTSKLTVRGEASTVTVTDSANSLIIVRATGSATKQATFTAPAGVAISEAASSNNVWEVRSQAEGEIIGTFTIIHNEGDNAQAAGSSAAVQGQSTLEATLAEGTAIVFRAYSQYEGSASVEAINAAAVSALAEGHLAAEATSEFVGGSNILVDTEFFTNAKAQTSAEVGNRVTTELRPAGASISGAASAQAGYVASYDLDFVNIPTVDADEVAVYVQGALAARANTAAEVVANAKAGANPSYFTATAEGRVLVIASTSSQAEATALTIAQVPDAASIPRTVAQLDAQLGVTTQVEGSYSIVGDLTASAQSSGQVLGKFNGFIAGEVSGSAKVSEYTDLRAGQEVFAVIDFAADQAAGATADVQTQGSGSGSAGASAVNFDTSVAGQVVSEATFTDAVFGSIRGEATQDSVAQFQLSDGISARVVSDTVIAIEGDSGTLGHIILADAQGEANSAAAQASSLGTTTVSGAEAAGGEARTAVEAQLAAGAEVVYRSASEAQTQARAEAYAKAVAAGQLGSEIDVGIVGNAIASASADHTGALQASVVTDAAASARGIVTIQAKAAASLATAISVNADKATLPAVNPEDIVVKVNNQAAARASSAQEVLAAAGGASGEAKFFVDATIEGHTQVLASLPSVSPGQVTSVVIESQLATEAKAQAAVDTFGTFAAGAGGSAQGKVSSMVVKPDLGMVLDYTVTAKSTADAEAATTTVFDAVQVGTQALVSASASGSSSLKFTSPEAEIEAHDTSSAVLKVVAKQQTTASFDLASDIETTAKGGDVLILEAPATGFVGAMILTKAEGGTASGSSLVADAQGNVEANLAAGTQVIFKAFSGFEAELSRAQMEAQAEAIAQGDLLGQVVAQTQAGVTTTAAVNYYSQVQAVTSVASANKVEILVDSAASAGKSIIISLDENTISGLVQGDAELLVDGKRVPQANSYQDALNPDTDSYFIITGEAEVGFQALVTLSHFSTRTVTLQTPPPTNLFIFTTIALAVVVVGQAVVPRILPRFRKKQW